MSLDNLAIDFSRLSFGLSNDHNNDSLVAQQHTKIYPGPIPRVVSRNKQCMPSDDEDEEDDEDEDENEDEDEEDEGREPRVLRSNYGSALKPTIERKIKKQLPSDDEDSDQDENENRGERVNYYNNEEVGYYNHYEGAAPNVMYGYDQGYNPMQQQNQQYYDNDDDDDDRALVPNPNAGPVLTLVEGSHLQQLQKKQQQHQAQLAQFQYLQQLHPNQHNNRHQHHQKSLYQHQNKSMSGMDLLKQLEQEKADLKRIKPKLDTSKVKIEGLLGNIPEPGSHNISFQQLQQQQKKIQKNTNSRPVSTLAAGGYLDPHNHHHHSHRSKSPSRSPSPSFAAGAISHYRNNSSTYVNK